MKPLGTLTHLLVRLGGPAAACVGFTLYPSAALGGATGAAKTCCCFREGSVASKPVCGDDPACKATRCLEKPIGGGGPNISALVPASVPFQSTLPIGVVAAPGAAFLPTSLCVLRSGNAATHFPAEFVNSSFVRCRLPSSGAVGDVSIALANRLDPGVQSGSDTGNALPLELVPALSVAVGRRPYLHESVGEVLVSTDIWPSDLQPAGWCTVSASCL
eukprot:SAG11_NODE_7667_length_1113_cov_0.954635_2_plen_217_part_00